MFQLQESRNVANVANRFRAVPKMKMETKRKKEKTSQNLIACHKDLTPGRLYCMHVNLLFVCATTQDMLPVEAF